MKKFFNALTHSDFWMNFGACAILAVFVATLLAHLSVGVVAPAILGGFFTGLFCGLGKEYGYSRATGEAWNWTNVVAYVLGTLIGCQIGWGAMFI